MKSWLLALIVLSLSFESFSQNNWEYSEEEDKMIDKKSFFASCSSINDTNGKKYFLIIRYAPQKTNQPSVNGSYNYQNEVYIACNGCIFDSSIYELNSLKIRFDKDSPIEWFYSGAKDNFDALFLSNTKRFIKKIKSSKSILIEIPLFRKGSQVIEFNVEGLKWNDL